MIALFAVLALSLSGGHDRPVDPFTFGDPAFCEQRAPVRDFGISRLPRVHELPPSGHLPFAPKTVGLGTLNDDPVLRPGEGFGYELWGENLARRHLDWTLRARIVAVDRLGRERRLVDHASAHVRTTSYAGRARLVLHPARRLGFYRYDISIFDGHGTRLATYSQYLRVVRKFWRTRLDLNRRRFKPGQTVLSRVENFGTEPASYGEEFTVQRRVGSRWAHDPHLPARQIWLSWAGIGPPGEPGRCSALELPADLPPGRYRIVKHVGRIVSAKKSIGYTLVAPFEVSGHAPTLETLRAVLLRVIEGPTAHIDQAPVL